jgi:predicted lipoprotein with Yx(FWY)xxD motif
VGRRRDRKGLILAILACAVCFTLAACGRSAAAAHHPDYEIRASTIAGLGRVLVDGRGYTLYAYVPDHHSRSRCYRSCASLWPPLLLPRGIRHPAVGPGVNAALVGTTIRQNGSIQLTYNKWPLYLYNADVKPGQAAGQGLYMGLWYVLTPGGSIDQHQ